MGVAGDADDDAAASAALLVELTSINADLRMPTPVGVRHRRSCVPRGHAQHGATGAGVRVAVEQSARPRRGRDRRDLLAPAELTARWADGGWRFPSAPRLVRRVHVDIEHLRRHTPLSVQSQATIERLGQSHGSFRGEALGRQPRSVWGATRPSLVHVPGIRSGPDPGSGSADDIRGRRRRGGRRGCGPRAECLGFGHRAGGDRGPAAPVRVDRVVPDRGLRPLPAQPRPSAHRSSRGQRHRSDRRGQRRRHGGSDRAGRGGQTADDR